MEKFIVTPKEDKSVTMTIRIDRALQEEYNDLAAKTNRSRNELISMALQCYAFSITVLVTSGLASAYVFIVVDTSLCPITS